MSKDKKKKNLFMKIFPITISILIEIGLIWLIFLAINAVVYETVSNSLRGTICLFIIYGIAIVLYIAFIISFVIYHKIKEKR